LAGNTIIKHVNEKTKRLGIAVHNSFAEAIGRAAEMEWYLDGPKAPHCLEEVIDHLVAQLDKSQPMFTAYELAVANVPLTIENICRVLRERCEMISDGIRKPLRCR
jgi:hypothetical protein